MDFLDLLEEKLKVVEWGPEIMSRAVNSGFSGGEKKRNEILQMAVLEPTLAILDETDSGLDIDALRIVADGVNTLRRPDNAMIVVTHYQRLLNYIVPDFVHVLCRRPDREVGRQGAGARARGPGLRVAGATRWRPRRDRAVRAGRSRRCRDRHRGWPRMAGAGPPGRGMERFARARASRPPGTRSGASPRSRRSRRAPGVAARLRPPRGHPRRSGAVSSSGTRSGPPLVFVNGRCTPRR